MKLNKIIPVLVEQLSSKIPVYTQVPDGAKYPYITLELDNFTFGNIDHPKHDKMFCDLKIKGWSRYNGTTQIIQIIEHIRDSLSNRIILFGNEAKGSGFCKNHNLQVLKDGSTRLYEATFQLNIRSY